MSLSSIETIAGALFVVPMVLFFLWVAWLAISR